MKATKKFLCLLLSLALTLCSLPLVAFAADGNSAKEQTPTAISFAANRLLTLHEPITKTPNTFHTVISLPQGTTKGGVIFGNYRSTDYSFFSLEVNASGNPTLRFTNAAGEVKDATFDAVDVRLGTSLTLTVVRTDVAAYCYVNGAMMQKLEGNFAWGDVMTAKDVWNRYGSLYEDPNGQEFILGGDNVKNNPNYFRGTMSSLVLYTEALSSAGVEKVMAGVCEYSPILAYEIGSGDSAYCVTDRSGNGHNASTTFYERPYAAPYESEDFEYSFVVVGDTQVQVETDNKDGTSYTANIYDYIVNNKESKKIGYVFGVGDITQNNTVAEWEIAKNAVTKLDAAGIGYSLPTGDHDNNASYYTYHENFNNTFRDTLSPRIAGFYDDAAGLTNYYMTFEVGTEKFAVLCLEVGPRTPVMAWANEIIEQHPDRKFIITTHSYLAKDGTTTDPADPGAKNEAGSMGNGSPSNGDRLWDELASLHENVFMVFSGHIAYENVVMRQDRGVNGNTVTQFLVNHQSMAASYSMVCMLYFSKDGSVRTEWISTTKSMEAGNDVFYKTQSMMSFNAYGLDDEGTLIAESRFDGGTNGISASKNGSVAQMSTDDGIYKLYFNDTKAGTYASFAKQLKFNSSYAYKYLTWEFDISTESELFDSIRFLFVPRASSGAKGGAEFYIVQKNGIYYLTNNTKTEFYPLGISHANEWAHITVVFDTENMIGGVGNSKDCVAHYFINGKYAMTNEKPFAAGAEWFQEMRLQGYANDVSVTDTLCIDNLVLKGFRPEESGGIDGVLEEKWLSLSSVKGLDYKEGYTFPSGTPLAKVTSNGTDAYYYNEFDLGASVKEGDTVTMLRDAYTPVSFANTVTVKEEGYRIVYDTAKDFSVTTADGTTFFTADEFAKVMTAVTGKKAVVEQYNDVTFTSHQSFTVKEKLDNQNFSLIKIFNLNGHSLKAAAQTNHFMSFSTQNYMASWIINNGAISVNSKSVVFTANTNDYLEFNSVDFTGYSMISARNGTIKLTDCVIRTSANSFLDTQANSVAPVETADQSVTYRNCDITMLETSPQGIIFRCYNTEGNDFKVTFQYCNIKRYSENNAKALIETQGTAGAELTTYAPVVNFIGTRVYSRLLAIHKFGELTINVTEGSKLDIEHTSIANCASWTGSTYLGNATEPNADRYKLTFNIEDGTYLSIKNLVDNTAGKMNAENLKVNFGSKNSYAKENSDPNLPYIVGAPDFTVKSSLTLYTDFDYNFMIPVDAGVDTFTVGDVTLTPVDVYPIGSEYYHRYTFEGIYVSEFAKEHKVSLVSDQFDLSLTVSLLSYAQKVLADEGNADAHQMIVDMLTYAKEAQAYLPEADADVIAAIEALIGDHEASAYAPSETMTKVPNAVAEYVNGVWISLGNTPAFKFSIVKNATITLSYVDADGNLQSHRYNAVAGDYIRLDMHLFDFASEITIAVDGVDEVGTYDLYTYINRTENDNNVTNDSCLPLVKALYNYVQSARSYKESV